MNPKRQESRQNVQNRIVRECLPSTVKGKSAGIGVLVAAVWFLHFGTWATTGIVEHNWCLPVMVLLLTLMALFLCRLLSVPRSIYGMMGIALLVRTLLAVFAWYQGKGTDMAYWTGLNEDSNRFFLNSYLPASEAIWTTEDKGFPLINSFITKAAESFGQDHYLINIQVVLICGVLFALATYAWAREMIDARTAAIAGWIIALHPIVVGWSTGLMRDTVVAAFGWFMVYGIIKLYFFRGRKLFATFILLSISAVIAWFVRSTTVTYLLGIAGLIVLFRRGSGKLNARKLWLIGSASGAILIILLASGVMERFYLNLAYGEHSRDLVGVDDNAVNDGGISAKMAQSGSLAVYAVAAPYAFIAPFPVYAKPTGWQGQPARLVDYVFNAGGLVNLVLFVLLLPGLYLWNQERRWDLAVLSGPVFWVVCMLCIMGAGQSRWVMPFLYPIVASTAALVILHSWCSQTLRFLVISVLITVLGVYLLYWLIKAEVVLWISAVAASLLLTLGGGGLLLAVSRRNIKPCRNDAV